MVIIIFHSTDCRICKNASLLPEANLFLLSRFRKFIVIWVSQFRASLFPPYCRSSRCTARSCLARSSWAASDRRLRATCSWRLWGRSHFETHSTLWLHEQAWPIWHGAQDVLKISYKNNYNKCDETSPNILRELNHHLRQWVEMQKWWGEPTNVFDYDLPWLSSHDMIM